MQISRLYYYVCANTADEPFLMVPRHASKAYTSTANIIIERAEFVDGALGEVPVGHLIESNDRRKREFAAIDQLIKDSLAASDTAVKGGVIANRIKNDLKFDISDWYGHGNFKDFIHDRVQKLGYVYEVQGVRYYVYDPKRHPNPFEAEKKQELKARVDSFIMECVTGSSGPVDGGKLANAIKIHFGDESKDWYDYSSFKDFMMDRAPKLGLKYVVKGSENFVYDPKSHQPPELDPNVRREKELAAINQLIKDSLAASDTAVKGVVIANRIKDDLKFDISDWYGHGNFKDFIRDRVQKLGYIYEAQGVRYYIYDPKKHYDPFKAEKEQERLEKLKALKTQIDNFIMEHVADSSEPVDGGKLAYAIKTHFGG